MTLPEITMAVEFFSGSMRPALWVFILKMNTLLDIKIQAAIVCEFSVYGAILKGTWSVIWDSLLSYCNFVHYET